jgi:hypothetical protein
MHLDRLPVILAVVLPMPAPLAAQGSVLVVDDDGGPGVAHTSLVAAVAAAGSGDTLLVKDGVYPGDLVLFDRSLSIVADTEATVVVQGRTSISGIQVTDEVQLRGLTLETATSGTALLVTACNGSVWLEDMVVRSTWLCDVPQCATTVVRVQESQAVHLIRTRIEAAVGGALASSLRTIDSHVAVESCVVKGAKGAPGTTCTGTQATPGSAAVAMYGGFLFCSGSTLAGGDGGGGGSCAHADCGQDGGHGLSMKPSLTDPVVVILDSTVEGGAGGPSGIACGIDGADGKAVDVLAGNVTPLAGRAAPLQASSPVREGGTLTVTAGGIAGSLVWLGIGAVPYFDYEPAFAGVVAALGPHFVALLGTIPSAGSLSTAFHILHLPPGVESIAFYGQIMLLEPSGDVRLGSPSAVTLLDAAF